MRIPWANLLLRSPLWILDLQANTYQGSDLGTQFWWTIRNFRAHEWEFHGKTSPKRQSRYQKGSDLPIFATLEEHNKEAPWGDTWKILILGQDKSLEVGKDLLTTTKRPSQIPTNLEEVDKYSMGVEITREDMAKLWSTYDILER